MFPFLPAIRWQRHGLFWVVVSTYFLVLQLIYPDYLHTVDHYFFRFDFSRSPYFLLILFSYTLGIGVLYAYAFLKWVMPWLLTNRYGQGALRYGVLTVIICYLFRLLKALHMAWLDPWLRHQPTRPIDGHHFEDLFFNQVYIHEYSTIILVLAIYKFLTVWQQKQQESNRLMQEKLQTQIRLVKAQVNPQFMVGNLDKLYELIGNRASHAPEVVLRLAHFLRYVLYDNGLERVTLARDVAAMQSYVLLEQERLSSQMDISLRISGTMDGLFIAPLLLLPFLENAFQHGLIPSDQSWVSLTISVAQHTLTCRLANSIEPAEVPTFTLGNGLNTIRKRLDTQYPDRYSLKLEPDYGVFVTVLSLELETIENFTTGALAEPLLT